MLAIGAFLMQFTVQGAWGVVPVHLNELSPANARGTFPGFVYQLGNLIASYNIVVQTKIATAPGGSYGHALALVVGLTALALVLIAACGREAREAIFGVEQKPA